MKLKKTKTLTFTVLIVAFLIYIFVESPNLNPFFYLDGAFFWAVVITAFTGLWALFRFGELSFEFFANKREQAQSGPFHYEAKQKFPRWTKLLLAVPWIFVGAVMLFSSFIFQWKTYRDQLGTSQVIEFTSDMQAIDLAQVPIVDHELALILADKKLGERAGLGSQVRLSYNDATLQRYQDKLVWAVPLHPSGVFKWLTNLDGTPGYILVSATDVNDVEYIENFNVKYLPDNYLLHDLKRHTRFGGAWFDGITDPAFEVDETGQPYWIYTTYRNLRGFNLPETTGAWVVNATTGEMAKYTIDTIPEWVDRIQPESFIVNQIDNKGEYVRGWFNFADKDKYRSSPGHALVYNNGRCYLFTGMTSVGADDSAIGFIMIDMITKESHVYQMPGATEHAAQGSAEGKVQHLGYYASFPLIVNIDGRPTYFMPLKDNSRLIKQYAFVSVENYSIVGTGETINDALRDYRLGLKNSNMLTSLATADTEKKAVTARVLRIAAELASGDTTYKIILEGHEKMIFSLQPMLSDELAITREGDRVRIEYHPADGQLQRAESFDNLQFSD